MAGQPLRRWPRCCSARRCRCSDSWGRWHSEIPARSTRLHCWRHCRSDWRRPTTYRALLRQRTIGAPWNQWAGRWSHDTDCRWSARRPNRRRRSMHSCRRTRNWPGPRRRASKLQRNCHPCHNGRSGEPYTANWAPWKRCSLRIAPTDRNSARQLKRPKELRSWRTRSDNHRPAWPLRRPAKGMWRQSSPDSRFAA